MHTVLLATVLHLCTGYNTKSVQLQGAVEATEVLLTSPALTGLALKYGILTLGTPTA